jgi:hypothetical protein
MIRSLRRRPWNILSFYPAVLYKKLTILYNDALQNTRLRVPFQCPSGSLVVHLFIRTAGMLLTYLLTHSMVQDII